MKTGMALVTQIALLLLLAAGAGLFAGCEQKPLPPGTCTVCRGSGKTTTCTPVYIGQSPGQPGGPGQPPQQSTPIYRYDFSTSACTACGGSGKTK